MRIRARGGYDATGDRRRARGAYRRGLQRGYSGLERFGGPLAGAVDAPRGALWAALPAGAIHLLASRDFGVDGFRLSLREKARASVGFRLGFGINWMGCLGFLQGKGTVVN